MAQKKDVFVIMPMSDTKHFSATEWEKFFKEVIEPTVISAGFIVKRSDSDITRGNLVRKIIENLVDSYAVLADITDYNPNVMYELGIRHALTTRTIMVVQKGITVPFDLKSYWYKEYDPKDKSSIEELKSFIVKALNHINSNPLKSDNPVSDFISSKRIKISKEEKDHYEIATRLVKSVQNRLYVVERTPVLLVKDIDNQWQQQWFVALNKWLNEVIMDSENKVLGLLFITSRTAKAIKQLNKEKEFFENLKKLKELEAQTPGKGLIVRAIPEYCGSFIVSDNSVGIWYKTDINETGIYVSDFPELADAYEEVFFRLAGERTHSQEEIEKLIQEFI